MPGKPYQSKLKPFEPLVFALLDEGRSYRDIARELHDRHGVGVTHNAVFSFVRSRRAGRRHGLLFYEGLAPDIRDQLLKQIAAEWTHSSTAIEGNTLTLGDTVKVLELGLTISGKPLREHQEVYGHARAIDLIYEMVRLPTITEEHVFALHRAVMQQVPLDSLNPVGDWKREYNGTTGVIDGKSVYMEYAAPADVPSLMKRWLKDFNTTQKAKTPSDAIHSYIRAHMILVRIHPFFDGNGRVARLVANIPVLRSGFPPVTVQVEQRSEYIDLLWNYQNVVGTITRGTRLFPQHPAIQAFQDLLARQWLKTSTLVQVARNRQAERALNENKDSPNGEQRKL